MTPDGKYFYVTCENDGGIFTVDAERYEIVSHFNVGDRPRSIDFLPGGTRAFIPSKSASEVHLIDTADHSASSRRLSCPKGAGPCGRTWRRMVQRFISAPTEADAFVCWIRPPSKLSIRSKRASARGESHSRLMQSTYTPPTALRMLSRSWTLGL